MNLIIINNLADSKGGSLWSFVEGSGEGIETLPSGLCLLYRLVKSKAVA
jgi:hypothetical protein